MRKLDLHMYEFLGITCVNGESAITHVRILTILHAGMENRQLHM